MSENMIYRDTIEIDTVGELRDILNKYDPDMQLRILTDFECRIKVNGVEECEGEDTLILESV